MPGFSLSFLVLFHQLSLGGLCALAVPPFHEMGRGFYKSTVGVLLAAAGLGLWGKLDLYLRNPALGVLAILELLSYFAFVCLLTLYLVSLWGERTRFRARSFAGALITGLAGLVLASINYSQGALWSWETFLFPVNFVISALLLGSATVGMLIGHWYLIDVGQSLTPFLRTFKFFVAVLILQAVFSLGSLLALYLLGSAESVSALERLLSRHGFLVSMRFLTAHLGPLILSYMIWQTLKIPNTMAATGLFYIALLGVFVGEILAKHLLTVSSLPF
jgi:hypothetical protein